MINLLLILDCHSLNVFRTPLIALFCIHKLRQPQFARITRTNRGERKTVFPTKSKANCAYLLDMNSKYLERRKRFDSCTTLTSPHVNSCRELVRLDSEIQTGREGGRELLKLCDAKNALNESYMSHAKREDGSWW